MGISLHNPFRGWACWKNESHRGKAPAKLLMALLNVTMAEALSILNIETREMVSNDNLKDRVSQMLSPKPIAGRRSEKLKFPESFKKIDFRIQSKSGQPFIEYLESRGYSQKQLVKIVFDYQLRYCRDGLYRYRLIFPVYTDLGLTTWTGRSIVPDKEPRYLTLSPDPEAFTKQENQIARANIKDCLFNELWLSKQRGKALLVGEGPFDAMKMDYVGREHNIYATCIFGKAVSTAQVEKLAAMENFNQKYIVLDPDAALDQLRMWTTLSSTGFKVLKLPGTKDPGSMTLSSMEDFIKEKVL